MTHSGPSISLKVEHWSRIGHMNINIQEKSSIHELLQIIKFELRRDDVIWGDGISGWHLFYGGRNLYNHTSMLNDYNIQDGSRISLLPGERMRDRVYLGGYNEREMCQAIKLSIRAAELRQEAAEKDSVSEPGPLETALREELRRVQEELRTFQGASGGGDNTIVMS